MGGFRAPAPARFEAKLSQGTDGCWLWTASVTNHGYGTFATGAYRSVMAHRWSYEYHVGPIPEGLHLDHLCRNRACVNPYHLDPVPVRVNLLRGVGNSSKTACPAGHPYSPDNTYVIPTTGSRRCRTCQRAHRSANRKQG